MKKVLLFALVIIGLFLSPVLHAQYCGGASGSNICSPINTLNVEGFEPPEDSLPCIVVGTPYSHVINVHTPTTVVNGTTTYHLNYVKIDTINNLPCGMCWAMGASNFQIAGNATGCLKLSGTTFDAPGQYLLHIIVDANVQYLGFPITDRDQNLASQGLKYFVRVQLPGDTCIKIDTLATGRTATRSAHLAVPVITGNTSFCSGGSTTLTATDSSNVYAYAWSNGTFNSSITVSTPGTYTVTVYGNCASATASKTIAIAPVRDTVTASGLTTFCQGNGVTLSVPTGSASYHWSIGATTNSITATTTGTYSVTVTNSTGCSAVSPGISITANPSPPDTVTANGPLSFCPGGSVILSGPAGLTYTWSNGATSQSIIASQSSSYKLTVTNSNNCSAVSSTVIITTYALPNDTVRVVGSTTICAGDSVNLIGASGLTYLWSNAATTQIISVTQAGSYTLTVTSSNNCSAVSAATSVIVNPSPVDTVTASGPLSFCTGGSVDLTVDQGLVGLTYNWSTGANTQSILATQGGTYRVTVTNGNNCSVVSAPITVTVNTSPSNAVTVTGPTTFCQGGNTGLSAVAGLTYLWSNSATTQNINATQSGSFTVTVTNGNNCTASSTPVVITVNPNPNDTVFVGGPTTFCAGGSVALTAVSGLTYLWSNTSTAQSITAVQTGSYTVTVTNGNNCSAVSSAVHVVVNPRPDSTVTAGGPTTFCSGSSVTLTAGGGYTYLWSTSSTNRSISATQSGSYAVTLTSGFQCTAASAFTVVTVEAPTTIATQPASQVTCINGALTFNVVANGANLTYQWQKNRTNINGQTGASFSIAQAAFSDTGSYRVVVNGACGVDTSNFAVLSVTGSLTFSQQPSSQIACLGSSVTFTVVANGVNTTYQWQKNGQNISGATSATYVIANVATTDTGSYVCSATSSCGNAISNATRLTVHFPTASTISQNICAGSSYNFNGRIIRNAGTYMDTLNNAQNCDSVVTLTLTVSPAITSSYSDSICAGSTYNFNGAILSNAGIYVDTLLTHAGCDSIITLNLSIRQHGGSTRSVTICQGQSYSFNGLNLTATGTYSDTLTGRNGCDSIVILQLVVNQGSASSTNATICVNGSYNFNGRILDSAGVYVDTLANVVGCDSIITLHLNVITTIYNSYSTAICAGGSYIFNSRTLTNPGVYHDTLPSIGGCDSVVSVVLSVNPNTGSTITDTICDGASYSFAGQLLTNSGVYYDTLNNAHGCDSIITLNLTVKPIIRTGMHASICAGSYYLFNGQHLTTSGTYYETLTTQHGCDSMVTLVLQVNSYVTSSINAAICTGSTYSFNGRQLSTAGTYYDTLTAQGGCDSIIALTLTINQPTSTTIHAAICAGGAYSFDGQNLTTAGTYTETLTGSTGCDSTISLILQINPYVTSSISGTVCQGTPYNFNGQNLTAAGTYRDTLTALGGCDSIVILTLTVNHPTGSTIYANICVGSTYLFNGTQLASTGTYFESLTGSNGCDSIITLQLNVNSFITSTTAANICYGSNYNFNGRVLSTAGTFTDTLTAQGGCDSIITLNLTVNPIILHNSQVSICAGTIYNFNGQQLSTPGTYRDTLVTQSGCDSISIINLFIRLMLTDTISGVVCHGGSFNFNGRILNAPGIYNDTLTAIGGCDSIVTLQLRPGLQASISLYDSICAGSSFSFNGQHLVASGTYADTVVTQGGCDSITILYLTIKAAPVITWNQPDTICNNNNATHIGIAAPSPAGGTLSGTGLNGLVLTVSETGGTYPVTYNYIDSNGCSNTVTKNLVVESCLGVDEVSMEKAISIYPNPANGIVIAQAADLLNNHKAPVVYDITGKSVEVPYVQQGDKIEFNTASLAAGLYWIKFNINGSTVSKRFVKAE